MFVKAIVTPSAGPGGSPVGKEHDHSRAHRHRPVQTDRNDRTMARINAPRGAPDLLPPESELLSDLEDAARSLAERYGYRRIEIPVFEHTELFDRTVGESSDIIVQKQMYTFP